MPARRLPPRAAKLGRPSIPRLSRPGRPRGAARRPLGPALRLVGAVLVAAGLLAAARWAPAAPPGWNVVERFGFDDAACEERLAEREAVRFVVPSGRAEPVTAGDLARWFRLDLDALCAANAVPPGGCAGHVFAAGQVAVLPLGRGAAGAVAAAPAGAETSRPGSP